MRNSSSLDWLRFMHTPNDYRVSQDSVMLRKTLDQKNKKRDKSSDLPLFLLFLLDLNQGPSD